MKNRVLVGSTIRESPEVLKRYLESLNGLNVDSDTSVEFSFIDNNDCLESSQALIDYMPEDSMVSVSDPEGVSYHKNDETHLWTHDAIRNVADLKNCIITKFLNNCYHTHLFFVDSDLILHPDALKYLLNADKDIVSAVFWTRWQKNEEPRPNIWLTGEYGMGCNQEEFFAILRSPALIRVGGLGACTLIKRRVLEAGVNFKFVENLDYVGEDRHFCVRAAVHGFELWADARFPVKHLYREEDLND